MHKTLPVYLIILAATALWCGLLIAAPLLTLGGEGAHVWSDALYDGFHRVCHQLDSRSLHLSGAPLPVCMRCSAIYFAFFLGTLLYPLVRPLRQPHAPSRGLLILALMPMLIDVAAGISGIADVTATSRLVTGAAFGFLIPFVVLPVVLGAVHEWRTQSTPVIHHSKGSVDA